MTYQAQLPPSFPFQLAAPPDIVRDLVSELLDPNREDVSQGSSFAVTVDNWNGTWNLWLSRASYEYLVDNAFIHGSQAQLTQEEIDD